MVFQNCALCAHKSVRDNIAYPLRVRSGSRSRALVWHPDICLMFGLVPVALAGIGWYGLHRLNRGRGWFRIGELIFWDVILLVLVYLVWLVWF